MLALPIVLALMLIGLAVGRVYLARQRTCVGARYGAWREARGNGAVTVDLLRKRSMLRRPVVRRDAPRDAVYGDELPRSGYGAKQIGDSIHALAQEGPEGLQSVAESIRSIGGALDFASIDLTCRDLEADPHVVVRSSARDRVGSWGYQGTTQWDSTLVRDVWYTPPGQEGFWHFFAGSVAGRLGGGFSFP